MKQIIRCSECEFCKELRKIGNTRSEFVCAHPDEEHIRKYFEDHKIKKMPGFIGFSKAYSHEVPVKTSQAWCPKKEE